MSSAYMFFFILVSLFVICQETEAGNVLRGSGEASNETTVATTTVSTKPSEKINPNEPGWKTALRWIRKTLTAMCTLNTYLGT
uniref:Uncharacterized protein n=1 Tax=Trichobilharzia regenti TaxID=157069 RepID=A0AA85IP10_TRIRE|nr:unnamed protein product [Trichobilharzia regenti]